MKKDKPKDKHDHKEIFEQAEIIIKSSAFYEKRLLEIFQELEDEDLPLERLAVLKEEVTNLIRKLDLEIENMEEFSNKHNIKIK